MSDGPIDYGSGYLFESQKRISDRRAARGLPNDARGALNSHAAGTTSGGNLLVMMLFGAFILCVKILAWIAPHAFKLVGWLLWEAFSLLWAVLSGGRRR